MNNFQAHLVHAIRYEFSDEAVLALIKPNLAFVQEMMQEETKVKAKTKTKKCVSTFQVLTIATGTELVARRLADRTWKVVDAFSVKKHKRAQIVALSTNLKAALRSAKTQDRLLRA